MYNSKWIVGVCMKVVFGFASISLLINTLGLPFVIYNWVFTTRKPASDLFPWDYFLVLTMTVFTLFATRGYLVFEKWDQLLSIKNKSKFLDLGYEGIGYLKVNLPKNEIGELRRRHRDKEMAENIQKPNKQ